MATGDVFQVAIVGTYEGEPVQMTLGLKEVAGGGGGDAMLNAAAAVNTALGGGTVTIPGLSHYLSITSLIVTDVSPGVRSRKIVAVGPHVGAVNGNGFPGTVAAVIGWETDLRGPSNRGRIFVPAVLIADEFLGQLAGSGPAHITAIANLFFTPFVTVGTAYRLCVLSFVPGSSPRTLRAAVPVVGFHVDLNLKTQRRRGLGVRISRRRSP